MFDLSRRAALPLLLALTAASVHPGCGSTSSLRTLEPKLKPFSIQATDFRLPSGMRVIFQEDRGQPSVIVATVVDVGSAQDPKGKEGLAHLAEHLWFRAHAEGQPQLMDRLKDLGCVFNAGTSVDTTSFVTVAPKDALEPLLKLEAERLRATLNGVTEEIFETEKNVVRNELRWLAESRVDSKIYTALTKMLYPADHPYHRDTIGTHGSIAAITLDDVKAFTRRHYRPENVTMVVDGNFQRAGVNKVLARTIPKKLLLGDKRAAKHPPKPRIARAVPKPPPPAVTDFRTIEASVPNPLVVLAWTLPGSYGEQMWQMNATVKMMAVEVGIELRPECSNCEAPGNVIGCSLIPGRQTSMAVCVFEAAPGQEPRKMAKRVMDGLWQLWNSSNIPLQRRIYSMARSYLMAGVFHDSASIWRAKGLARLTHYTGRSDLFSHSIKGLSKINAFKARELAFNYLNRERAVKLIVKPAPQRSQTAAVDANELWDGAIFRRTAEENKRFLRLPLAAIERTAVAPAPASMQQLKLKSGLTVVLKRHGKSPFVKASLYTNGGWASSSPAGLSSFVRWHDEARDPMKIAGISTRRSNRDGQAHELTAPSGNLADALTLLLERVRSTKNNWDSDVFERQLKRIAHRERREHKDPEERASRWLWGALLPGHPLSVRTHPVDKLRAEVSDKRLEAWIEQSLAPRNATLIVLGDLDLDRAAKLVRKIWGDWRHDEPGERRAAQPPPDKAPRAGIFIADQAGTSQTKVMLKCRLQPATADNDADCKVLATLLREDLWQAVRAKTGASYGVNVKASSYRGGTTVLQVSSYIQSDKAIPALASILGRLAAVGKGELNLAHLNKAKWTAARRSRIDNLSINAMLDTLTRHARDDAPLDNLKGFPHRLAGVSPARIARLLRPCVGQEVIALVGPKAQLQAAAKQLGRPVVTR